MSWKELSDWRGNRADAGRLAHGLPKSNKFLRGVECARAGCVAVL
jgi:topoisomerase-4 subunit A